AGRPGHRESALRNANCCKRDGLWNWGEIMSHASRPLRALALAGIVLVSFAVDAGEFVPGEVIVKYKSGAARTRAEMNALYARAGVERVRYYSGMLRDFEQLLLEDGVSVEDAIERLSDSPI